MNIGFLMVGVSYGLCNQRRRDWRRAIDVMYHNAIFPLMEHETVNNVKLFAATNKNITSSDLVSRYPFEQYKLISFPDEIMVTSRPTMKEMYLEGLQLISYAKDIDFVISTRFDILFYEKLTNYKFDFDKFNVPFKEIRSWDDHKYVSDAMFAFPIKYLQSFMDSIQHLVKYPYTRPHDTGTHLHAIYSQMEQRIGEQNINFLFDGQHSTGTNKFFSIMRDSDIYEKWNKMDDGTISVCFK